MLAIVIDVKDMLNDMLELIVTWLFLHVYVHFKLCLILEYNYFFL